jgi:hypothetical protein
MSGIKTINMPIPFYVAALLVAKGLPKIAKAIQKSGVSLGTTTHTLKTSVKHFGAAKTVKAILTTTIVVGGVVIAKEKLNIFSEGVEAFLEKDYQTAISKFAHFAGSIDQSEETLVKTSKEIISNCNFDTTIANEIIDFIRKYIAF